MLIDADSMGEYGDPYNIIENIKMNFQFYESISIQ